MSATGSSVCFTWVRKLCRRTKPSCTISRNRVLAVDGVLPAQLTGVFLQSSAHPAGGGERRQILSGIEFADGAARLYRAPHAPAEALLPPTPGLTAALPDGEQYRIVL